MFVLGILGNRLSEYVPLKGLWLAFATVIMLLLAISIALRLRGWAGVADGTMSEQAQRYTTAYTLMAGVAVGAGVALLATSTATPTLYWIGGPEVPQDLVELDPFLTVIRVPIATPGKMVFVVWAHELVAYIWAALLLALVAYFQSARDAMTMGLAFTVTIPAVNLVYAPFSHDALSTILGGAIVYGALAFAWPIGAAILRRIRTFTARTRFVSAAVDADRNGGHEPPDPPAKTESPHIALEPSAPIDDVSAAAQRDR
jgi:hypothetical protein